MSRSIDLLFEMVLSGKRGLLGVPLGRPRLRLTGLGLLSEVAGAALLSPCPWCDGKDCDYIVII